MTQFAWTKILEVWEADEKNPKNKNVFLSLIRERTLPAILASDNVLKSWKDYIKWLKGKFKEVSSEIDVVANGIELEITNLSKAGKINELRELIKKKFLDDTNLIKTLSGNLEKQVDIMFNENLAGEAMNLFRQSALPLLDELKTNFKSSSYKVSELAFLSAFIQDIYIVELPNKWQESWTLSEPHLKLENFGDDAKKVVNDFFKTLIHLLDNLKPDNESDIDKIQGKLLKESLKLADLVEQERINELKDRLKKVDDFLTPIIKEEVNIIE